MKTWLTLKRDETKGGGTKGAGLVTVGAAEAVQNRGFRLAKQSLMTGKEWDSSECGWVESGGAHQGIIWGMAACVQDKRRACKVQVDEQKTGCVHDLPGQKRNMTKTGELDNTCFGALHERCVMSTRRDEAHKFSVLLLGGVQVWAMHE